VVGFARIKWSTSPEYALFNVPEAQGESVVEPDGVTDDLGRETVPAVAASVGFHQPSLLGTSLS
jgi:hypothetical protein